MQPKNPAAQMIVSAQSIITDLTTQRAELLTAMSKQQALIDSLIPVAEWEPAPPVEEPEPDPSTAE